MGYRGLTEESYLAFTSQGRGPRALRLIRGAYGCGPSGLRVEGHIGLRL